MTAPAQTPGAMRALSIDYSEDELDALADLFGVPALGSPRLRRRPATGTEEAVLRATLATATRGLVARRAMMLSGTAIRPKVELLEPHATVLRAFLGSRTLVSVERRRSAEVERYVVFVRDDVCVEQRSVAGRAILRMTAHPVAAVEELVWGPIAFDDGGADTGPASGTTLEVAARTLERTPDEVPGDVPAPVRDLIYARRQSVVLSVTRQRGTAIERATSEWLDAGALGLWRVEREEGDATVRLSAQSPEDARAEVAELCREREAAA